MVDNELVFDERRGEDRLKTVEEKGNSREDKKSGRWLRYALLPVPYAFVRDVFIMTVKNLIYLYFLLRDVRLLMC